MKEATSTAYPPCAPTCTASFGGTTPSEPGIVHVTDRASTRTARSSTGRLSSRFLLFLRNRRRSRAQRNSHSMVLAIIDQIDRSFDRLPVDCQFRSTALQSVRILDVDLVRRRPEPVFDREFLPARRNARLDEQLFAPLMETKYRFQRRPVHPAR